MIRRRSHVWLCAAATCSVLACADGGELRLRAILPAPDGSGERPWLEDIGCYRVQDLGPGLADPIQISEADDPDAVSLGEVDPGRHVFRVQGLGRSCDGASPNPVIAEGETEPVEVRAGTSLEVPYFFAPVERFSTIEVPDWVETSLYGRRGVSIGAIEDDAGETLVLFSGGEVLTDSGFEPTRDTILLRPREMTFEPGPELACARAYHASVPARARRAPDEEFEPVLAIVGGGGSCPGAGDAVDAAGTMEAFAPNAREIVSVSLPGNAPLRPVSAPAAVAYGDGGILVAGGSRLQRYLPESGWATVEENAELPFFDAVVASREGLDAEPRYVVVGGLTERVELAKGPILLDESLDRCSTEFTTDAEGGFQGRAPMVFFLAGSELLVMGGMNLEGEPTDRFRIYGHGAICGLHDDPTTGSFAQPRAGASAARLRDGRFLVVGGDAEQTAEVYVPEARGSISLDPLPTGRDAPTTVLLPDGTVLVAGGAGGAADGGGGVVDVFNPAREVAIASGEIEWDPQAVQELELDVLVIVSTAPTAGGSAAQMQSLLANGNRGTVEGVLAAIRDLEPEGLGDVELIVIDAHVGVVTGDLGCSVGEVGDDGRLQGEELDGASPFVTNLDADEAFGRAVRIGDEGCPVQQLVRAAIRALQSPENVGFLRDSAPLFVVFATSGDDCSIREGQEAAFFADGRAVSEKCADPTFVEAPADLVMELVALKRGDFSLVNLLSMAGDPERGGSHPFVGWLAPAGRLADMASVAFAAGAQGFHASLDENALYAGQEIAGRELEPLRDLLLNRLGRNVCLPPLASGYEVRCVLTYDGSGPDGAYIERIPQVFSNDQRGWRAVRSASDRCVPVSDTDYSPRVELVLNRSYQYPVGPRVRYACE